MDALHSSRAQDAILCRDIEFGYAATKPVLCKLCMHVPANGCIYSLLGASSSGKTTLIKIITGTLRPTGGEVRIFGELLGSDRCSVPGSGLGYMPQDLYLYPHFSIEATLSYYAQINGMKPHAIKERIQFLQQHLELPESTRSIVQLSGGQQRRVSLAVALIHSPPLMILDEPTVGTDPVLRSKIWTFLRELRKTGHTIFVTTHYIEETVASDLISYIRNGQLICELKPQTLMSLHGTTRLETAVYELCKKQDEVLKDATNLPASKQDGKEKPGRVATWLQSMAMRPGAFQLNSFSVVMRRTWRLLACDWFNLFMMLLYPAVVMYMVNLAFHQRPEVNVAVHNFDSHPENASFADQLVKSIAQRVRVTQVDSAEEVERAITQGQSIAGVSLGSNFSECFAERIEEGVRISDEMIDCSQIRVHIDTSHFVRFWLLVLAMADSFKQAFVQYLPKMGANPKAFLPAIDLADVITGKEMNVTFDMESFFVPGQMAGVNFMLTLLLSGLVWLKDRENGTFERSQVHRVSQFQFFLAHGLVQMLLMLVSNVLLLAAGVVLFHLPVNGNLLAAYLLLGLLTASTILLGQLMAITASCHTTYLTAIACVIFPLFFVCPLMWPLESISYPQLRTVALLLPLSRPIIALRALVSRNLPLSSPLVYDGFLTVGFYIAITLALCLLRLSR